MELQKLKEHRNQEQLMSNRLIKTEIIDVADRLEIMYKQMQKNQKRVNKIIKTIDKNERVRPAHLRQPTIIVNNYPNEV